ncbi:A disintegrin and metalloproteinase with thrombospondin motifs 16 [Patella vulgata]|uniref:A disintegrin and metalloproteinase with thrombospondin motifs 16 n=1 Tax=Patella vulgata TaxID=6465 RepID=UPI0024A8480D|nr:A disintegrin and metalloproteinase with thrombospondin motifs 16 [Patella vulgata]
MYGNCLFYILVDSLNAQTTPDNKSELRSHQHQYSTTNLRQTVETLVVADKTMVWRHGRHNITTYILSILNIVSKLFEDNSLGKPVEILLVGLVVLETDEPGLHISHHADYTLNSFCQWQSTLSDATGRRHDHAILLTGLDICSNKNAPCDTLGFAPINGMCNPLRSCIMNEDTGLATAFTVTHEIGHNFGMFHDGEGNNCKRGAGNIMSPTLTGRNGLFQWSSCSRNYFLKFLNTIQSNCLSDRPTYIQEFKFPDKLPGELYDATTQCKWLFGPTAKVCSYEFGKLQVCKSLWCYKGNKMCETKFLPAAEGTKCGVGMWCRHSKCEKKPLQKPKEINGGWSPWTPWTRCSRTCGGGIQKRNRKCNNPKPKYNGKPCIGELVMFSLCNTQACTGSTDFRSEQCQEFDKKLFRGWFYNWTAYKKIQRGKYVQFS